MCVKHQELFALSPNARIVRGPREHCVNTTTFVLNNAYTSTYRVVTHAGCICNEYRALTNRHLVDRSYIKFDASYYRRCARKVVRELDSATIDPVSYFDVISGYTGPKRKTYLRALEDINTYGFDKRWAYIKMFVKPDKYPAAKAAVKPPRAIQYRTPAYNLLMARYLKPMEEWFYQQTSPGGFRFIAKGLNNVQRAELLRDQTLTFKNPAFILLDHAAFDSTINVDHLKSTHNFYKRLNPSRRLQDLLKYQLKNKGFSKHGIRYTIKGTRMSGDYDTAFGNSFINYVVLRSWLRYNQVKGEIILDGDDSIVVVERSDIARLNFDHFEKCGFETKHQIVYNINEVEFCQSKYLPTEPPRFSRDPIRALSRLNISIKSYHGSGWRRYQAGIGRAEMALNQGVPILYRVGEKLAALSQRPIFDTETAYKIQVDTTFIPVTDAVRVAFWRAWGISPAEQLSIESDYTPFLRAHCEELLQGYYSLPEDAETTQVSW